MAEWSDNREKVLCGCGVVSWTQTKIEGGRFLLKEPCPGCDKTDHVDEIGSIEKMSHKKAKKIIETLCDLLESNPVGIIGGGLGHQVESLAQYLEDINRVIAAERVRKGWKMLLEGVAKGFQNCFPGHAPQKPALMGVPGCMKCRKGVMDYRPEWRWKLDGLFCSECRSSLDKATRIMLTEKRIAETKRFAGEMLEGVVSLNKQLEELQVKE